MSKKLFSSELLIGLTAMIISLSTLVVFIYQTDLIRKQQYKSVYPHLSTIHMHTGSPNYEYVLRNQGIGPAFITSIEVKDSTGKSYQSIVDYVRKSTSDKDSIMFSRTDIFEGSLIEEKEKIILIKLNDSPDSNNTIKGGRRLREILSAENLKLTVQYESIYGESWTMKNSLTIPIKN